jgi:hypothetical protein
LWNLLWDCAASSTVENGWTAGTLERTHHSRHLLPAAGNVIGVVSAATANNKIQLATQL